MAHFALLWKARTIEKYRQNYENEKYLSIRDTNIPMPQKSLSQRLRCYRQDTQKRFSKIFQRIYPEGSSLSNFFLYLRTDQICLNLVLKSLLGFLIGLGLTYLCFLFLVFQLSISLFHATIVSSIIGVLLTMGLAFSYRIRCLIFLLLPQFFSRAGRYTLTCYALVLILTGPATNTLKNSEVLTESMACRQEQIKTLLNELKDTARRPLNALRESIKIMVLKIRLFAGDLKQTLLKVNRLTLSILETIQSTFSWLQWLSGMCNKVMGSPFDRCVKVLKNGIIDYKRRFDQKKAQIRRMVNKIEEVCSNVKHYKAICVFTDFVNGSFVASIRRRLKDHSERIRNLLYVQIHVYHSYYFSTNTSHSASQVAAGIVTEIRKRADPLLTWLSWSSCVTSLFLLLIIFRAKYYQHMFETRSRFDNKYITRELRDLDLNRLRHGKETILPLNKRERSKYVSTTSFRLVASEKIHLNRSIVFMAITTFKLLIHMVADYSLYWVLVTIRYHGKNQTPLPFGVPNAGMHITGTGRVADMLRSLLSALTTPLERSPPSPTSCLPDPHPPNFQRYSHIGFLIFLLWFVALFEPYGLRLRHVIMGLYRPERAKSRAEWLYNHILRTRGGFMKFARRKLHRSYKYNSEQKYTFKRWLNEHIPFCWIRYLLGIPKEEVHCLMCGFKLDSADRNTKLEKCNTQGCPGVYCCSCFADIGELCTICLSPSDYGDLSDVSLEKGSSDESDDDSNENDGGHVVPENNHEISEQDIFDDDSDDILLPKPLRNNKYDSRVSIYSKEGGKYYKTRLKKETFDKKELSKPNQFIFKIILTKKHNVWNRKNKMRIITISKNANWNIFQNNFLYINIMEINNIENNDETSFKEKRIRGNSGQDKHISEQKQNRPVSKDISDKKDDRKQNSNDLHKKTDKNEGLQRKGDSVDVGLKTVNKSNPEQEFPCCSFKQFIAVFCSNWLSLKNNLFNRCNLLSKAMINNTSGINDDEMTNFKSRKKVNLEIPESNELLFDTENSRNYRIFSFLAEQEWVIKKTIKYESTEKEISLLNDKADTKTIEHLKEDLYSHTVHFQDIRAELTSCNTSAKQHVLVCEDCKFNCLCPGNPLNFLNDLPVVHNDAKEVYCNEKGIILSHKDCMAKCAEPKPMKASALEKLRTCLKSLFLIKCKKKEKVCENKCLPKNIQTHTNIIEKQKPNCVCEDRSIQFDENDCPYHNRSIQVILHPDKRAANERYGQSTVDERDESRSVECQCRVPDLQKSIQKRSDSLYPVECENKGQRKVAENCDPICPIECQCKGEGLLLTKCDPLCPRECTCKARGKNVKKCDELCPEECSCKVGDQESLTNNQKRRAKVEKCSCAVNKSENANRLIEPIHKLRISSCLNEEIVKKVVDNNTEKCADEQKKRGTDVNGQCSENDYDETNPVEDKFCSCAIQCLRPECDKRESCNSSTCSSCTVSIISNGTMRSDFTETDKTCYVYYETPKRRPRFVLVTKRNQSTVTDAAVKCNVGTETNDRSLSQIYYKETST